MQLKISHCWFVKISNLTNLLEIKRKSRNLGFKANNHRLEPQLSHVYLHHNKTIILLRLIFHTVQLSYKCEWPLTDYSDLNLTSVTDFKWLLLPSFASRLCFISFHIGAWFLLIQTYQYAIKYYHFLVIKFKVICRNKDICNMEINSYFQLNEFRCGSRGAPGARAPPWP